MKLTPQQKIQRELLLSLYYYDADEDDLEDKMFTPEELQTPEQIDEAWQECGDQTGDAEYEMRQGEVETGLDAEYSRHYESKSVAMKCCDGTWVGWTYWYGGGKHGEPESIPWMENAYDLECVEEEKLVTVRTFTKVGEKPDE